jgi:thiamine-phosphate pyrophosphorylase
MQSPNVTRMLDASLNRASEGLRVVEDYVRFVLDDRRLTEQFKQLRHDLAAAGAAVPGAERYAARDTLADVGTAVTTTAEGERRDAWSVCVASLERLKQSLRSLEEYSKVDDPAAATQFESLRYRLYTLEPALGRTVDALGRLADARLYVLIDGRESESIFVSLVESLVEGGVDLIQLRDKSLSDRQLLARARLLIEAVRGSIRATADQAWSGLEARHTPPTRPLLIINDRPDIAAIVDADGVHLGQEDMPVKDARQIVGPRKLIGVSTHSIEQARDAVLGGANYIGVGPTFPSKTKQFDAYPGLPLVAAVAAEIKLPAFAIGGVTLENVSQVAEAGLPRVAVSRAITAAPEPLSAARSLRYVLAQYGEP